jgi:hypothetical protein
MQGTPAGDVSPQPGSRPIRKPPPPRSRGSTRRRLNWDDRGMPGAASHRRRARRPQSFRIGLIHQVRCTPAIGRCANRASQLMSTPVDACGNGFERALRQRAANVGRWRFTHGAWFQFKGRQSKVANQRPPPLLPLAAFDLVSAIKSFRIMAYDIFSRQINCARDVPNYLPFRSK